MRAETLTRALGGRWHGSYGTARCPAHDDSSPSLSIKDGREGRVLLHCFAGCEFGRIRSAVEASAEASNFAILGHATPNHREANRERSVSQLVDRIWSETVAIEGNSCGAISASPRHRRRPSGEFAVPREAAPCRRRSVARNGGARRFYRRPWQRAAPDVPLSRSASENQSHSSEDDARPLQRRRCSPSQR